MAYRAKSINTIDHPAQNRIQHKAIKQIVEGQKLERRINELTDLMTPHVQAQMGLDERAARKQAKRWIVEAVADMVASYAGYDTLFIGD